ncbi:MULTISPECIES: hypothetical protein [Neisseria]|uniref:Homoserine kinase n=1 Tax=Neisseria musculi TaxID=1815583 RepID=A0A7H1M918_9NEIS|nr:MULTISPECIES: hypothetical protein [Neisseria]MBF0805051.1 hypothetical protein [Neisseria sp. 19428wB4_WF04]QNT58133.1 putative homoserine kinase [Neisseria musculi]TFU38556.1 hypothetical protein E4T99_12390 [Neisseria sp. WF04]
MNKSVFLLEHARPPLHENDNVDVKLLDIFSSEEAAQNAISALSDKPGFRDHPDGFGINEHELDTLNLDIRIRRRLRIFQLPARI